MNHELQSEISKWIKKLDKDYKENQKIVKYFAPKKCLIVDTSGVMRSTLRKMVVDFGIESRNVLVLESLPEAKAHIFSEQIHYVFTNSKIKGGAGLDLLPTHIKTFPNRLDAGFFLFSSNRQFSQYFYRSIH